MNIKAELESIIKDLKLVSDSVSLTEISNRFSFFINKLKEKDDLKIVTLGSLKRGKSMLVNALIGEKLLPSDKVPATSVLSVISSSDNDVSRYEVYYYPESNKKTDIITKEDIKLYVTEKENPKNIKDVFYVGIQKKFDLFNSNVLLIDTPGVGSIYPEHTKVTYNMLQNVDVAILVLGSEVINRDESMILSEISKLGRVSKFFIVQNFLDKNKDEWDHQNWNKALEFNLSQCKKILNNENIKIYPISSINALKGKINNDMELLKSSGFLALENDIKAYIQSDTSKKKIYNLYTKGIIPVVTELKNYFNEQKKLLDSKNNHEKDNSTKLKQELQNIDLKLSKLNTAINSINNIIQIQINEKFIDLKNKLFELDPSGTYAEKMEKMVREKPIQELNESLKDVSKIMNDILEKWSENFSQTSSKIVFDIYDTIKQSLDLNNQKSNSLSKPNMITQDSNAVDMYIPEISKYNQGHSFEKFREVFMGGSIGFAVANILTGGAFVVGGIMLGVIFSYNALDHKKDIHEQNRRNEISNFFSKFFTKAYKRGTNILQSTEIEIRKTLKDQILVDINSEKQILENRKEYILELLKNTNNNLSTQDNLIISKNQELDKLIIKLRDFSKLF